MSDEQISADEIEKLREMEEILEAAKILDARMAALLGTDNLIPELEVTNDQEALKFLQAMWPVLQDAMARTQEAEARMQELEARINRLERARRMTADEALEVFEALKRLNPGLTLKTFADDYGMKYDTLVQIRHRRRKQELAELRAKMEGLNESR